MGSFCFFRQFKKIKTTTARIFFFVMNEDGEWKLAPAYDLTPSEVINGKHIALVNGKGASITDDDFKAVAERFGIKGEQSLNGKGKAIPFLRRNRSIIYYCFIYIRRELWAHRKNKLGKLSMTV